MATKFMSGTELFMYECMMQQTPNMARCEREEKRFKAQYIGLLRDFMREYGYGEISKRVTRTIDRFLFDEFVFCNEEHRDMFWRMYSKWIKNTNEKDFTSMAIIYLLSTHRQFETILANYVSNPLYVLPSIYEHGEGVEKYNLYHAVKMIAGMESGLCEEDLFEEGMFSMFNEQMDKTVTEAKAEIESHLQARMEDVALKAIGKSQEPEALPEEDQDIEEDGGMLMGGM